MNTRKMTSLFLAAALFAATIQPIAYAATSKTGWANLFARKIIGGVISNDADEQASRFGKYWANGTDTEKLMALGLMASATWFIFNTLFTKEFVDKNKDNKKNNIFSYGFGFLGMLGLKSWINQKMDEGQQEVQKDLGIDAQVNTQEEERVVQGMRDMAQGADALGREFLGFSILDRIAPANQAAERAGQHAPAQAPAQQPVQQPVDQGAGVQEQPAGVPAPQVAVVPVQQVQQPAAQSSIFARFRSAVRTFLAPAEAPQQAPAQQVPAIQPGQQVLALPAAQ